MEKISIILPSYKRHALLLGVLQNIESQVSSSYDIEVIVVNDNDTVGNNLATDYLFHTKKYTGMAVATLDKLGHHAAWNLGLSLATGNLFVHMGDDGRFHGNALEQVYNAHTDKLAGYGMVAFNDLNLNGDTQVGTHVLFDRQFCKDVLGGVMVVPHYKGYCVDLEFNDRARAVGKYYWCSTAILEHLHSSNGKRELSEGELDRVQYSETDTRLYNTRKAAGFPNDFDPVI